MATGSGDKTAKIYEAASGKELFTITGHTDQVWFVKFTPDGKSLATGSFDGTVRLWNIPLWERFMGI
jgi:WD40 repeat protein